MQQFILDALRTNNGPTSAADLRFDYEAELEAEFDTCEGLSPQQRRSVRMSMDRALRQLKAAGHIKRDWSGNWYPAKNWTARDDAARERSKTAYHEAGHAVIGLALKLPVAFATIKPRASSAGHVS
jgi:hypothetical protein